MSPSDAEDPSLPTVHTIRRRYVALGLVVVAIILLGALIVIRSLKAQPDAAQPETFTPAPSSVLSALATVPASVIDAVGATSGGAATTAPAATNNPSLWQDAAGLPVVFFYGAEYSPYAAAERWPLVQALSRFGTFTQLGLAQSSGSVAFPGTASFTFWHVAYTSRWLQLQAVERYGTQDPTGVGYATLEKLSPRQAASVSTYDLSATTFPLLDVANRYVLQGSGLAPSVLAGLNQAEISTDLTYADSPVTQAIVTGANDITADICTVTRQRPAKVCSTRGVRAAAARMQLKEG